MHALLTLAQVTPVSLDPVQALLTRALTWVMDSGPIFIVAALIIAYLLTRLHKMEDKLESVRNAKESQEKQNSDTRFQSELANLKIMEAIGRTLDKLIESSNENNAGIRELKDFVVAKSDELLDAMSKK